jgi:hypothetical protein
MERLPAGKTQHAFLYAGPAKKHMEMAMEVADELSRGQYTATSKHDDLG